MIKFPTELKMWKHIIERKAKKAGLSFFNVIFEIVTFDQMNEIVAYGGFPTRRAHWGFGQEYESHKKFYSYGLQKIYEMVINNDPSIAYLLEVNNLTDNKLVIAHVYAHVDFFTNNVWFSPSPKKMLDEMANHRYQIEKIKEKVGEEKVDNFIDRVLSIEWLVDDHSLMVKRAVYQSGETDLEPARVRPLEYKEYMDRWLNPLAYLKEEKERIEKEKEEKAKIEKGLKIPLRPTRDIILFLINYAPLEPWQKEILAIIREENYYFIPQAQTQIMNEGWASYWHDFILTQMGVAGENEIIDYADHAASSLQGFVYKLGYEIFRDIKYRWDTGRHGKIYEECQIAEVLERWDDFMVFKTFFDECQGDKEKIQEKWQEFCILKATLKNGQFDFPRELAMPSNIIKHWHEYLDAKKILEEQKILQIEAKKLWGEAIRFLRESRNKSSKNTETSKKRYELKKVLAQEDLRDIKRSSRLAKIFLKIKEAIKEKKLYYSADLIPPSFYEWAEQNQESIELNIGTKKIFEVRKHYNDVTFIEEFFTIEICEKMQLFTYEPGGGGVYPSHWGIVSRQFEDIKRKLLFQRTHRGQPTIELVDANYENRGKMYLKHSWEGTDLRLDYMKDVLLILYDWWQRPVCLETVISKKKKENGFRGMPSFLIRIVKGEPEEEDDVIEGEMKLFTYNGKEFKEKSLGVVQIKKQF